MKNQILKNYFAGTFKKGGDLFIVLIYILTSRLGLFIVGLFITSLFYSNMKYGVFFWQKHNIVSSKQWTKILNIETIKKDSYRRGEYTIAELSININNTPLKVKYVYNPVPKKGDCIPVIFYQMFDRVTAAEMDHNEILYGITYGRCDKANDF